MGAVHLPAPSQTHSLEFEGLSQLCGVAGVDLEDAAEGVRVTPVRKFCKGDRAEVKETSGDERNHTGASDESAGLIISLDNYRRRTTAARC